VPPLLKFQGTPLVPDLSHAKAIGIPFEIRRGHVMVPASVGGTNSLSLLLDTGYGMTMLNPHFIELLSEGILRN
jgi:hypothetical protein